MKDIQRFILIFAVVIAAVTITTVNCSRKMIKSAGDKKAGTSDTSIKDNDKESAKTEKVPDEILKFTGKYDLTVPGFKGLLLLKYNMKEGSYAGEIQFAKWGNNESQPLKNLSINDGKIYFVRSVETATEIKKYGSSRYFTQKYYGKFSSDGSDIKGEFTESGAITNWRARR